MERFYSIEDLKSELVRDKSLNHPFPVRFILVEGLDNWQRIIAILEDMAECTIRLSECCTSQDTKPDLYSLKSELENLPQKDVLIVPLAEYLRLFKDSRDILRELAIIRKSDGINSGTKQRIFIPLFEAEDMFFEQMKSVSRFGSMDECAKHYWIKRSGYSARVSLQVMAGSVDISTVHSNIINGIKDYMQIWEKTARADNILVTNFAPIIPKTMGDFSIEVFNSAFELLRVYVNGGDKLRPEWGNTEQWSWLLSIAKKHEYLNSLFLRVFNLASFDVMDILKKWQEYDEHEKWLAWIWCKLEQPGGYLKYIFKNNSSYVSLQEDLLISVFDIDETNQEVEKSILRERKRILECFDLRYIPQKFWDRFNAEGDSVRRLKYLTCITFEEKCKAIEIVRELLKNNIDMGQWYDYLAIIYPELAYYMCTANYDNPDISNYFRNYIEAKLEDEVTDKIQQLAQDAASRQLLWGISPRNSLLERVSNGCIVYWADGMGAEWLGLIEGILRNEYGNYVEYEYKIARANLPTVTRENKGWETTGGYKGYKDYDKKVHDYECTYPKYIVEEFEHIRNIIKNAVDLLNRSSSVIITADHGSSRLAAIDKRESITVPDGIVAEKHGRYCINDGSLNAVNYKDCIEHDDKLIFTTHRRFNTRGHVQGEIHGGATLEEVLIPIIILRKKDKEDKDIQFDLVSRSIRLNARNEATIALTLTAPIERLMLIIRNLRFEGVYKDNKWEIALNNLKPGQYKGIILADNKKIGEVSFVLTKGMTENDMGL